MRLCVPCRIRERHGRADRHVHERRVHGSHRGRVGRRDGRRARPRQQHGVGHRAALDRGAADRPATCIRRRGAREAPDVEPSDLELVPCRRFGRWQLPVQLECPQVIAARRRVAIGQACSASVQRDVILAVDAVGDRAAAYGRTGLEAPQLLAGCRIEREEIAIGSADEGQVALRGQHAHAVRLVVGQALLPLDGIGGGVDRNDGAGHVFSDRAQAVGRLDQVVRSRDVRLAGVDEARTRAVRHRTEVSCAVLAWNRQDRDVPVRGVQATLDVVRHRSIGIARHLGS